MKTCPLCATTEYPDSVRTCPTHGLLLSDRREFASGSMFAGTYRIEGVLGRGGMGVVYLAEHVLFGEKHALKFLAPELAHNPMFVQRFLREARRTRSLRDPHVVEVHFMGQSEDGSFYIAMEYVDGPNLAKVIASYPQGLPVERALKITRGIAEGLRAAHAKGMVHRDIKPENVLLARGEDGFDIAKITDFGIVTGTEEEGRLTRTGMQPLTPDYASPEQWKGVIPGHELDGRTDLYALGCVLFEMLTGRPPFDGRNMEELREQHVLGAVPLPSSIKPELAQWMGLDALVMRLMSKAREQRPGDVAEFLVRLDRLRKSPQITVTASVETRKSKTPDEPEPILQSFSPSKKRSKLWPILVVFAVILLGGGTTWYMVQSRNADGDQPASTQSQHGTPLYPTSDFAVSDAYTGKRVGVFRGEFVPYDYLQNSGAKVIIGRPFTSHDFLNGATGTIVISYAMWHQMNGGDPNTIGRMLQIKGRSFTVVGVLQRGFKGAASDQPADFWMPLAQKAIIDSEIKAP